MNRLLNFISLLLVSVLISCSNGYDWDDFIEIRTSDFNLPAYNELIVKLYDNGAFKSEVKYYSELTCSSLDVFFVGSSTIALWHTLNDDFDNINIQQRGLGGAVLSDIIIHGESLFLKHMPETVVLYIGDNDPGAYNFSTFKSYMELFVENFSFRFPDSRLILISVKPSPERYNEYDYYLSVNALEKELSNNPNIDYVDIWTDIYSNPSQYFSEDGLHMNSRGYNLLVNKLKLIL